MTCPRREPATAAGHFTLVLALLVCGTASSCRRPSGEPGTEEPTLTIHSRWIDEAPQELFSFTSITRLEEADVWGPDAAEPAAAWRTELPALRPRRNKPKLKSQLVERRVDFDAGDVDVLEIGIHPTPKRLTLAWSAGDGDRPPRHSLTLRPVDAVDGAFRFMVGTVPEWSGRIRRLRLTLTTPHQQPHRVTHTAALGFALQGDQLSAALERPWQVALHGEVRSARLNLPGTVVEHRLQVPENAWLRFSYALPTTARVAVRFQVLVQDLARGSAEPEILFDETLFEDVVDPGLEEDVSGWKQAVVDLGRFAGRSLAIQLANPSDGALDPLDGMPVWGNPEILATAPPSRPPNILLISLDTLRADHLSLYGYPRPTSPNIDRWARESGVVFRSAVTSAPWTLPSHLSLFTGIDALRHGVNHASPAPARLTLMAEHLRQAGYATAAVTGGSFLHPKFGLSQGFDFYRSSGVDRAEELADGSARATDWLAKHGRNQPFFLFFHTYEIHDPYEPRQPWFERFAGAPGAARGSVARGSVVTSAKPRGQRSGFRLQKTFYMRYAHRADEPLAADSSNAAVDRYDSGIAYVDAEIGKLLQALEDLDLDNTIVVLTSDHGESLGEHGLAGHGYLYDDNLLVPLVISAPGHAWRGRRIDDQVRLIDVLPTVLELAGLEPAADVDGLSLLPLIEGGEPASPRAAFSYSGHYNNGLALRVRDRLKYVFLNTPWRPLSEAEELYVLAEDPGELRDVAGSDPRLAQLRKQTRTRFEGAFSGLRIRLHNAADRRLRGRLQGNVLSPFSVRTTSLGAACKWQGGKGLAYTLPAGKSLELLIENVQSAELEFSGSSTFDGDVPASFEADFTLDDLAEPQTLQLDDGEWRLVSAGGTADVTGLTFAWVGERDLQGPSPVAADAELQKQLKALGYID